MREQEEFEEWGQGVLNDGAVILCDGIMVSIDDVVATLNQQASEIKALRRFANSNIADSIFEYIRHGDFEHREWLKVNLKEWVNLYLTKYGLIDESGKPTPLLTGEANV